MKQSLLAVAAQAAAHPIEKERLVESRGALIELIREAFPAMHEQVGALIDKVSKLPFPLAWQPGEPPKDGKTYVIVFTLNNPKAPGWPGESNSTNAFWGGEGKGWLYALNTCDIKQSENDVLTIHFHSPLPKP
jgi:hypothetical protein